MMEKSTEPNESNLENKVNETSEIKTNKQEDNPVTNETEISPIVLQLNFETLELEAYPSALKKMIHASDWTKRGKEIQELIAQFDSRFGTIFNKKRQDFIAIEGNDLDFEFSPSYKKEFSQLVREYKANKSAHYKSQEKNQKENLEKRLEIIEEIKALIGISENNSNNYKKFRALQESWHQTGPVPRAESNNVWETYKHHVERFYDFLHLDRALRDKDFKHNYEEKLKLIERAEALVELQDVVVAIRELNVLHRQWKNDLGPVAREHREELWTRFQSATAKLHDRKNEYNKNIDAILLENLEKKRAILSKIEVLATDHPKNHNAWQNSLKQVNGLKEEFHNLGRIPRAQNKTVWNEFRSVLKNFNHEKNQFYKNQKSEEKIHIELKKKLITEVSSILESSDWRSYIERMKAIQAEWKKSGRISRKLSNKLWQEFKEGTDLYFDRLKNKEEAFSPEDQAILKAKRSYFEDFKKQKTPKDPTELLAYIEHAFIQWNAMGNASEGILQKLNNEFNGFLNALWENTKLKPEEKKAMQFKTGLILLKNNPDGLQKEHSELKKKIDESKTELNQLENNLAFFNTTSNENPLVQEVNAKIEQLNQKIDHWNKKVIQIKALSRALSKSEDTPEDTDETNDQ